MIDKKQNFIDDYMDAALESPHESRSPNEIHSDAEVEWEASEIDRCYEQFGRDR